MKVKVTCPACGHVRLPSEDVRLVVTAPPRGAYYRFRCPACDRRVRRPAPEEVVAVLTEHGVPTVRAVTGSTAGEPASRPDSAAP